MWLLPEMLSLAKAVLMKEVKAPFLFPCPLIDRFQLRSSKLSFCSVSLNFLPHTVKRHLAILYTNGVREVIYPRLVNDLFAFIFYKGLLQTGSQKSCPWHQIQCTYPHWPAHHGFLFVPAINGYSLSLQHSFFRGSVTGSFI